jgi:hypothetical protein
MPESFYVGVWKARWKWKALLLLQDKASFATQVVLLENSFKSSDSHCMCLIGYLLVELTPQNTSTFPAQE